MFNEEYTQALGSLIQNGVDDLKGVNAFADELYDNYYIVKNNLSKYGYDDRWSLFQRINRDNIIDLYNHCKTIGIRE